ncbi:hypothetical protein AKJ51_03835 [candidate division MSBL1 archaeon SCGC-AAA382A20]|uniref:Flavodoxin-like domain-containing protein n=1 Tax=candidate division MSBL1 archaeon SCGC-AAA382A20 TaxID=1698280 RepID=A0A133VIU3_9EURY|nr:hypothetical protein AKJ51_03835 [candidate division MSBL1 archaeon SCGC-AAA382A20]
MRSLVVYYSRTGNTRFVAENIADFLDADVEGVIDKSDRSGPIGWIKSGFHATLEVDTEIEKLEYSPSNYDLVILGSPVWNKRITPAMRTYLKKSNFSNSEIAFFNTNNSDKTQNTFDTMKNLLGGKEPISTLVLSKVLENKKESEERIEEWCGELKSWVPE